MTDTDVISVTIDGQVHRMPAAVFRRILTSAAPNFERLKREEGRMFPAVDKAALDMIRELQFKHRFLI